MTEKIYNSKYLLWAIMGFGIVLRVAQYLANRSLWLDEAHIAQDILSNSFSELFNPYYPNLPRLIGQTAPLGFFLIEKFAVFLFGQSEFALRLFPLIFGICALFLFYHVTKRYIAPGAISIAMTLFTISDSLIYYSSELNQYSGDVFFVLIFLVIADVLKERSLSFLDIIIFGLIGALVVWFSNSIVFVMAGTGFVLITYSCMRKRWVKAGQMCILGITWGLSFIAYYYIYLKALSRNVGVLNTWIGEGAFLPLPPVSASDIWWIISTFFGVFSNPMLSTFNYSSFSAVGGIAAVAFIVGCISMYNLKKLNLIILLSPVFLALVLSAFYLYPFLQRTLLFLTPLLILIVAEGTNHIAVKCSGKRCREIAIVFIALLIFSPLLTAGYHLVKPRIREEIKPVLSSMRDHWRDGDIIYLHYASRPAFKYYSKIYGFGEDDYVYGIYAGNEDNVWEFTYNDMQNYIYDIDKLRGRNRVWFLFAQIPPKRGGIDIMQLILYHLNDIGRKLDTFGSGKSVAYLFDLQYNVAHD